MRDLGDKVSTADRGQIEQIIEDLKQARNTNDLAKIRNLTERLQQASHALTQQLYSQQQPGANGAGPTPGNGTGKTDDDVVEGEYRTV